MRAVGWRIAVVVVAVVLLVVLEERRQRQRADTTEGEVADDRRQERQTGRRRSRSSTYNEGEQVHFKVDSDVSDEVHVHGYDIMKDVKAGGSVSFDFPADDRRHLRGGAGGPQGADPRTDGQPVSCCLPFAHALVARKDLPIPAWLFAWGASIVLIVSFFALSVAWREPRFEEERWRPLGAGLSRALLGLPAQIALRRGRRLPARRRDLRRPARHRSARSQLRADLPLRHRLARLPAVQRRLRRRLPAVQPVAGDRPGGRGGVHGDRRPAPGPPPLPRAARAAGRRRSACSPSSGWRSSTAPAAASRSGLDPHAAAVAALVYSGYTLAMMALFGVEEWCRTGRGLLGLLRDVLPARLVRGQGRPARGAAAALGRDPLGDGARLGRGGDRLDRQHQLRRRPGGGVQGRRSKAPSNGSSTPGVGLTAALRLTDTIFMAAPLRRRRPRLPDRRAGDGDASPAPRRCEKLRDGLRPHADPDRLRLPRRPLLQPLRLPGAGAVHLPALRPAGNRDHRPLRHRLGRDRLPACSAPTRSGTSRSARSWSAT